MSQKSRLRKRFIVVICLMDNITSVMRLLAVIGSAFVR